MQHARFARHHDEAVFHLPPATGPQTVAVERGADPCAVGEGEGGRAVPRLHQAGLVFVVGLEVVRHALVAAPRLRNEHADRLLDRPAGEHEQFQHIVEGGRVAAPLPHDRLDLVEVGPIHGVREHALPRVHPVDVAADGVDLAVVRDEAEGMGEVPGRERVGAVPLMHEGQRACHLRVGEVGVILVDLIGQQQALVDDRPRRKGADVDERLLGEAELAEFDPEPLPQHEQLPLEVVAGGLLPATHERLPHDRLHLAGGAADEAVVGGHVPPAEELEALFLAEFLEELLRRLAVAIRRRQEDVAHGPVARGRQLDAGLRCHRREKFLRHLQKDAGAVARERVAATGAAMREVFEHLEPLTDDLVALQPVQVDDKPHAAGVMLIGRIVEALGWGKSVGTRHCDTRVKGNCESRRTLCTTV